MCKYDVSKRKPISQNNSHFFSFRHDNACFGYKGVKTSHSIAVRIEPSATYSKESFPPIDFSVLSKDARACVGNVVSVQGIVTNVEILPVDKNYVQILYHGYEFDDDFDDMFDFFD